MLHGQPLARAVEVVPGVWVGGEAAAAEMVESGKMRADDFRFFAVSMGVRLTVKLRCLTEHDARWRCTSFAVSQAAGQRV